MRTWKIVLRYVVILAVVTLAQSQLRADTILISGSDTTPSNQSGPTTTGFLNTQFGSNQTGTSFIPFSISGQSPLDMCTAMATDSSGKIVLAGTTQIYDSSTFCNRFAIARFSSAGILDTTLINEANTTWNGTNYIPFNIGVAEFDSSEATCMAIQSDGKIVVGGYSIRASGNTCFAIARFNSNGTLDTSFGRTGGNKAGTNLIDFNISGGTHDDQATSIGIDNASGNIYLGGWSTDGTGNKRFALACFTPAGVLNTTQFNKGGGGRAGTTFINASIAGHAGIGTADDQATCMSIVRDIAVAGQSLLDNNPPQPLIFLAGSSKDNADNNRFAYAVFNLDGTSSTAFNNASTGYLSYSIAGAANGNGDDQITCLQTRVTNYYTELTKLGDIYNQLNVPVNVPAFAYAYSYAYANAFAFVNGNINKNTSTFVYAFASTFTSAYEPAYTFINKESFKENFVNEYLKIYKKKYTKEDAAEDAAAKAIAEALGIDSNNTSVSSLVYYLAKGINLRGINHYTTPPTILLQAGGFSKDASGNYCFAVAQFTNQQGAIFGQGGTKNGSAYVPFSISGKTTGNDRATGITTAGPNGDIILGGWTQDQGNNYHFACADFLASGSLNLNAGTVNSATAGTTYINYNILGVNSGTRDQSTCAIPAPTGFYLGGVSGYSTGGNHSRFAVANYRYPSS